MWSIFKGGWSVLDRSMQKKFPWMLGSVVLLSALETLGISIVLPVVLLLVSPETVMDRPYVRSIYTAFGFQSARDFTATLVVVMIGALIVKFTAESALPILMTPGLTLGLFTLTVVMCIASAIAAIVQVMRIDPAVVFAR